MEERYSRAELIKQARESFARPPQYVQKKVTHLPNESIEEDTLYKWKPFMIRTVVSIILFLLIISADKMSLSYNEFKSSSIQELIATNQTVEMIQKYTTDFTKEKIIPVFHRLW